MWGLNTIIALGAATLAGGPHPVSGSVPPKPLAKLYTGLCLEDGEIGSKERGAADAVARSFMQHVLEGDAPFAYEQMSVAGKASVTAAQFAAASQSIMKSSGPFSNLTVEKTYLIQLKGSAPSAICGDLSHPQTTVTVRTASIPRQSYVVLSAATLNNRWAITVWMEPEAGTWRARAFSLNISGAAGRSAQDVWTLASAQARAGHGFNATLLYGAARGLANRGPNFQLGILPLIQKDLVAAARPPELKGSPPFMLALSGKTWRVSDFTTTGIAGKLVLIVKIRPDAWSGDAAADQQNRRFLTDFMAARPEVREVYGAVVAQSLNPDGTGGFATVYDMEKGILLPPTH